MMKIATGYIKHPITGCLIHPCEIYDDMVFLDDTSGEAEDLKSFSEKGSTGKEKRKSVIDNKLG